MAYIQICSEQKQQLIYNSCLSAILATIDVRYIWICFLYMYIYIYIYIYIYTGLEIGRLALLNAKINLGKN